MNIYTKGSFKKYFIEIDSSYFNIFLIIMARNIIGICKENIRTGIFSKTKDTINQKQYSRNLILV
jgi:hypothetical protein